VRNKIGIVPAYKGDVTISNKKSKPLLAFLAKWFIAKKNGDTTYVLEYEEVAGISDMASRQE
jgi:hypothetical protein